MDSFRVDLSFYSSTTPSDPEGLMAFIAENAESGDDFLDYSIDQLNYFHRDSFKLGLVNGEKTREFSTASWGWIVALGRMMDETFRFYLSIRNNDVPLLPPSYFYYDELIDRREVSLVEWFLEVCSG